MIYVIHMDLYNFQCELNSYIRNFMFLQNKPKEFDDS